jgi:hypothetical protein
MTKKKKVKTSLKVPVEVGIMGIQFKIKYQNTVVSGGSEVCGETVVHNRTIKISKAEALNPESLLSTILHEIIHAILGIAGHDSTLGEKEEAVVVSLENGLRQLVTLDEYSPNIGWETIDFTFPSEDI